MIRTFLQPLSGRSDLPNLLKVNLIASTAIFFLLEIWRPYFFLTGRHPRLKWIISIQPM